MMKKTFSILMALICLLGFTARAQQLTPLPLNPNVRTGVLPNGLTYYVLHNEEPKERANFYIAQKVGSTLETPEQLGLAHFLEHMAFNGTEHYPGKSMLEYLQSKGIRFGQDINAYTAFDETVYNINNIPTSDKALMDSVLLVLSDWSGSLLLEEAEIDAERGVIEGEWRQRNNADTRMYTAILPQIYSEYQYQQMPIGKMEIVRNFKPEVLRAYYHKWYRPDQQGIIVVGDFDVAEMEKKIVDLFSKIPMPENAAPREYPVVSDNEKPIFASFADPELQQTRIMTSFKYDKTPVEMRNTVEAYVGDYLMHTLISGLINNRINEFQQKPECDYAGAGVWFADYYVSKTKGAFNVVAIAKDDMLKAYEDCMSIVARACKTGFTDSEIARVRDEMLASYERMYNERNKTNTEALAKELIKYFIDNDPAPGIEMEYQLVQQILPNINAQMLNAICAQILTSNNQVIVLSQPQNEGMVTLSEEVVTGKLNELLNANYEAYVDEVITDPLISKLPKPGKIKKTEENANLGTTEFTLSNGMRVIIKPTDFAADEISVIATREGGKRTYPVSQANNLNLIDQTFDLTKWGPFDGNKLQKYLAGKKVGLSYNMNIFSNSLSGFSTVKDFPTLMELIYCAFTSLSPDTPTYEASMSQLSARIKNVEKDPRFIFSKNVAESRYGNNPMMTPLTEKTIENSDYATQLSLLKESMANAADYTFIFTGNIDPEQFKILANQYLATLPSKKKAVVPPVVTPISQVTGKVNNEFTITAQTPAVDIFELISGKDIPWSAKNENMINLAGEILQIIYTETLREEMGGTYGAGTAGFFTARDNEWNLIYQFQTNADQKKAMMDRATSEMYKLLREGAKAEHFNKVKEAAIKQLEINERTNSYWTSGLAYYYRGFDSITNARQVLESITLEDLNAFMKKLAETPNSIKVVMNQVAE